MGKKKPSPRQWTVHLEMIYRRDRDDRLARAYELVLPLITRTIHNQSAEEKENETTTTTQRHLRPRLQRKTGTTGNH